MRKRVGGGGTWNCLCEHNFSLPIYFFFHVHAPSLLHCDLGVRLRGCALCEFGVRDFTTVCCIAERRGGRQRAARVCRGRRRPSRLGETRGVRRGGGGTRRRGRRAHGRALQHPGTGQSEPVTSLRTFFEQRYKPEHFPFNLPCGALNLERAQRTRKLFTGCAPFGQ